MLVAFRRSAVSHALRSSPRTLSARSTPQQLQSLYSSISGSSYAPRSLFHSSTLKFSALTNAVEEHVAQPVEQEQAEPVATPFQELGERQLVSPSLIQTITQKMRLQNMTEVQRLTIPESLKGGDLLAQAKTGTGKTLAFLIPVMERLVSDVSLQKSTIRRGRTIGSVDIRAIIISPTRELAEQIAVEAKRLASGSGVVVQTAVGGTQKRLKLQQLRQEGCHILVATPGRLKDILSDHTTGVTAPKLSALVLDEADRLLDEGFAPELMEIQHLLPDPKIVDRQTLMFSATVARNVMGIVRRTMKPDFQFVKTISDDEVPTHFSVPQRAVILRGLENAMPALLELAKLNLESTPPFKAIVYLNSTKQTGTAYEAFDRLLSDPENPRSGNPLGKMFLGEIHSRLSQSQRTRVANWFRKCQSGILFSSDVTARGMDFPGVTHVVQIGVPRSRDDYIHRLGRTARAGKKGEGWVFLHQEEVRQFNGIIRDIPIDADRETLRTASIDMTKDVETSPEDTETLLQVKSAFAQLSNSGKEESIKAHLATLRGAFRSGHLLREAVQNLAIHGYGLRSAPGISMSGGDGDGYRGRQGSSRGSFGDRSSFGGRGSFRDRNSFGGSRGSGGYGSGGRGRDFGGRGRDSGDRDNFRRRDYNRGGDTPAQKFNDEWA
ncbi:P-loop containing nucleoside triphosphate hydrolase protein [Aspergillus varians]